MIFQSKQKVNGAPVWEVDIDTQTVRHRNPKTGETERYVFHTDHIRYYLHHIEEKRPDLLQEIVDKVTHKNIQSLLDTQRLLLLDELEQCVELIANARTVLLFGIGSSLCVAKDTYLKFLRLDKPCVVNEDSHSQLLQARNATAQDVGIVFSYSGQTMEMIQCIKEMKAGGAPVIAVTRYYPSEVAQLADHVLYVAANESLFRNGAMSSRLSQLNVVDILYTAYASRNHEDTMRRLTKTHIYKPGDPEVLTQP